MKKIQLFIHRHYDGIKLVLLLFVAVIALITLLQRINDTNREAEERATTTREIVNRIDQKTNEIVENASKNTLILCTLIVRGSLELNPEEIVEVERICQQEIDRLNGAPQSNQFTPTPEAAEPEPRQTQNSSPQSQNNESSSPNSNPSTPPSQPEIPQDPEEPNLVERLTQPITNIIEGIL